MKPELLARSAARLSRNFVVSLTLFGISGAPWPAMAADAIPDHGAAAAESGRIAAALRAAGEIPGLSVAVGVDDRIVWAEGFGLADLETPAPVTPNTRFRAASVSKVLTIAALARMAQRGVIDLDSPIRQYVPSFPDKNAVITPRLLAGHLGGIRHYVGADFANDTRHFDSLEKALPIFAESELVAPPGTRYVYSTFGYTLLGAALEKAAETDFLTLMRREVFEPLGMRDSGGDIRREIVPGRTSFYERGRDGALVHAGYVDPSYKWPGGGLLTTPSDLVRFGLAHLRPGYLPADAIDAMFTSQKTRDGKATGVGLGWRIAEDWKGRRIIHHSGSMSGTRSSILIYPDEKLVIALMTNLTGYPPLVETSLQMLAEPFLASGDASGANQEWLKGNFTYRGTLDEAEARGVISLKGEARVTGAISTPEPLSKLMRQHGAPDTGTLPIVGAFEKEGTTHLVLASLYGLLPLAVEKTQSGFRALMTAPSRWEIEAQRAESGQ